LFFLASRRIAPPRAKGNFAAAAPWIGLNALAGPTLGVGCYQWALAVAPTAVVLPIVATTPVVAIPLVWLIDGDRPSLRSIIGGVIAVAGSVALTLV
jgi:drug/metabolite transporter (DMT)-like permease